MSTSATQTRSGFTTVVHRVDRFPFSIRLLGYALLLVNIGGFVSFLTNLQGFAPGLPENSSVDQIGYMLAGRQLGVAIVFALALFGHNIRFLQLAWGLAILRELADIAGTIARGQTGASIGIGVLLVAEIAIFIYLGAVATGRIAKYRKP